MNRENDNNVLSNLEYAMESAKTDYNVNMDAILNGLSNPMASTGTPINDLCGAPRITAILSNIGGGSKATGGGGMEEGFRRLAAVLSPFSNLTTTLNNNESNENNDDETEESIVSITLKN
ncbi:MAG: hypothetical protein E7502_08450 [Ruminococcus sp.]|nr:hypothetical protein [Ruminococcus sp.]